MDKTQLPLPGKQPALQNSPYNFSGKAKSHQEHAAGRQKNAERMGRLKSQLGDGVSPGTSKQLQALSLEPEEKAFFGGLIHLGVELKQAGDFEKAGTLLTFVQQEGTGGALSEIARLELDSILGRGHSGLRSEVLLGSFLREATDYRMIVPMLAGSLVGQIGRAAVLGRLTGAAEASWITRGMGARFTAGLASYAIEVPIFALGTRSLSGSHAPIEQDLARAGLSLGALKLAGGAGSSLQGKFFPGNRFASTLLQPSSTFLGLLAAHKVEQFAGLRPHVDGATFLLDTLAAQISLGVGARLGHRALGQRFANFQRELELRSEGETAPSPRRGEGENRLPKWIQNPILAPMWMAMGMGGPGGIFPRGKKGRAGKSSPDTSLVELSALKEYPHSDKLVSAYHGITLESEVVSREPIHNLRKLNHALRESFLDILISGEEDGVPLHGDLAQSLREDGSLRRQLLQNGLRVEVRWEVQSGKILSLKAWEGAQLTLDLLDSSLSAPAEASAAPRVSGIISQAPAEGVRVSAEEKTTGDSSPNRRGKTKAEAASESKAAAAPASDLPAPPPTIAPKIPANPTVACEQKIEGLAALGPEWKQVVKDANQLLRKLKSHKGRQEEQKNQAAVNRLDAILLMPERGYSPDQLLVLLGSLNSAILGKESFATLDRMRQGMVPETWRRVAAVSASTGENGGEGGQDSREFKHDTPPPPSPAKRDLHLQVLQSLRFVSQQRPSWQPVFYKAKALMETLTGPAWKGTEAGERGMILLQDWVRDWVDKIREEGDAHPSRARKYLQALEDTLDGKMTWEELDVFEPKPTSRPPAPESIQVETKPSTKDAALAQLPSPIPHLEFIRLEALAIRHPEWKPVSEMAQQVWREIQDPLWHPEAVARGSEALLAEIQDWMEMLQEGVALPVNLPMKYLGRWKIRLGQLRMIRVLKDIPIGSNWGPTLPRGFGKDSGNTWHRAKPLSDNLTFSPRGGPGELSSGNLPMQVPPERYPGPSTRQPMPRREPLESEAPPALAPEEAHSVSPASGDKSAAEDFDISPALPSLQRLLFRLLSLHGPELQPTALEALIEQSGEWEGNPRSAVVALRVMEKKGILISRTEPNRTRGLPPRRFYRIAETPAAQGAAATWEGIQAAADRLWAEEIEGRFEGRRAEQAREALDLVFKFQRDMALAQGAMLLHAFEADLSRGNNLLSVRNLLEKLLPYKKVLHKLKRLTERGEAWREVAAEANERFNGFFYPRGVGEDRRQAAIGALKDILSLVDQVMPGEILNLLRDGRIEQRMAQAPATPVPPRRREAGVSEFPGAGDVLHLPENFPKDLELHVQPIVQMSRQAMQGPQLARAQGVLKLAELALKEISLLISRERLSEPLYDYSRDLLALLQKAQLQDRAEHPAIEEEMIDLVAEILVGSRGVRESEHFRVRAWHEGLGLPLPTPQYSAARETPAPQPEAKPGILAEAGSTVEVEALDLAIQAEAPAAAAPLHLIELTPARPAPPRVELELSPKSVEDPSVKSDPASEPSKAERISSNPPSAPEPTAQLAHLAGEALGGDADAIRQLGELGKKYPSAVQELIELYDIANESEARASDFGGIEPGDLKRLVMAAMGIAAGENPRALLHLTALYSAGRRESLVGLFNAARLSGEAKDYLIDRAESGDVSVLALWLREAQGEGLFAHNARAFLLGLYLGSEKNSGTLAYRLRQEIDVLKVVHALSDLGHGEAQKILREWNDFRHYQEQLQKDPTSKAILKEIGKIAKINSRAAKFLRTWSSPEVPSSDPQGKGSPPLIVSIPASPLPREAQGISAPIPTPPVESEEAAPRSLGPNRLAINRIVSEGGKNYHKAVRRGIFSKVYDVAGKLSLEEKRQLVQEWAPRLIEALKKDQIKWITLYLDGLHGLDHFLDAETHADLISKLSPWRNRFPHKAWLEQALHCIFSAVRLSHDSGNPSEPGD